MKLYKISGSDEYVDWDVLHNQQGYSLEATNSVTWMSTGDSTHEWGESVQTGYLEPIILRFTNSKGFCLGVYGWHTLSEMALEYGLWPDEAEEEEARSSTLGVSKVAVLEYTTSLRPPEIAKMYLVQKELEEGWMNEDTFAERGWEIVPDVPLGELVFVDASGAVVYSVESLNEMTFAPTGYFTIDDSDDVVFVEQSPYPARGSLAKNYTPNVTIADGSGIDTGLPYYSQKLYIPVVVWHDENWNLGTDYFGWDLSDASGSIYATNNTGSSRIVISVIVAMIDATNAEVVEVRNQSDAHFYAFKWTSVGVPYWYVVDGDEDWTDDLQADGYEEVPAVVLPTVTMEGDFASYNWLRVSSAESVSGGGNTSNLTPDGANYPDYNTGKSYAILLWQQSGGITSGRVEFFIVNANGKIQAHNNTSGTLTFYQARVAVCSSNQASVVTVYNSSNVAYNAFKYTANNTDYYYVLDGVQADWTDDLASIGYEEVPAVVLPTVSVDGDWSSGNWLYANTGGTNVSVLSGSSVLIGTGGSSSPAPVDYDTTKSYSVIRWATYQSAQGSGHTEYAIVNNSGKIYAKNVTSGDLYLYAIRVAVCSDSTAIVVTVYDSSNTAFNAFLYTASGTDYYYVLDGTQTDWTDDLSSIGYSELVTSYFRPDKDWRTLQTYNNLYDDNGNRISYQAGKTYTLQTLVGTGNYLLNTNGWLQFHFHFNGTTSTSARFVKYTVS